MRRNGQRLEQTDGIWSEPLRSTGGEPPLSHTHTLLDMSLLLWEACLKMGECRENDEYGIGQF